MDDPNMMNIVDGGLKMISIKFFFFNNQKIFSLVITSVCGMAPSMND
jgi:hypothetical protein